MSEENGTNKYDGRWKAFLRLDNRLEDIHALFLAFTSFL